MTDLLTFQAYSSRAAPAETFYDEVGKIALVAILVSLCLYALIPEISHWVRIVRSQSWPKVSGTVRKGEVLHSGPGRYLQLPFRSLLGYAYKVKGTRYWGLFVLPVRDMEEAELIQKRAPGESVTVQYNPKRPEVSLLVDRELCGRRISQNPTWLS